MYERAGTDAIMHADLIQIADAVRENESFKSEQLIIIPNNIRVKSDMLFYKKLP